MDGLSKLIGEQEAQELDNLEGSNQQSQAIITLDLPEFFAEFELEQIYQQKSELRI